MEEKNNGNVDRAKSVEFVNSISSKTIAWMVVAFACCMVALFFAMKVKSKAATIQSAVTSAEATIDQYKMLRSYYTKNVVQVAKQSGGVVKVHYNHEGTTDTIPLPATMIHDLSKLTKESASGIELRLYSRFPFPNRKGRELDEFANAALDAFDAKREGSFASDVEEHNGRQVVRVAIGDRMVLEDCVKCHNEHPQSPKTDWKLNDVRGVLEVIQPIDAQLAANANVMTWVLGISILAVFLVGGVCWMLLRKFVMRPIDIVARQLMTIAEQGDLTARLPDASEDEMGALSRTMNAFLEKIHGTVGRVQTAAAVIELTMPELQKTSDVLSTRVGGVAQNISSSASSVSEVAAAAEEVSSGTRSVASSTEEASAVVRAVSAGMEEMTSSLAEVSKTCAEQARLAEAAIVQAGDASEKMNELGAAARQIGKIVDVISDISDQTNLLSLNATIEAASAGEAGKGFAVVAAEVKALAKQTADATKEIAAHVASIQQGTNAACDGIMAMSKTIGEFNTMAGNIAMAVEQQSEATVEMASSVSTAAESSQNSARQIDEIARSVDEIARNTDTMSRDTEQVAHAVKAIARVGGAAASLQEATCVDELEAVLRTLAEGSGQLRSMLKWFKVEATTVGARMHDLRRYASEMVGTSWDAIQARAGVALPDVNPHGTYRESEYQKLVQAAAALSDMDVEAYERAMGQASFGSFAKNHARELDGTKKMQDMFSRMNGIHAALAKAHPGSLPPRFEFETGRDDQVVMRYPANNGLGSYYVGLIEGAAEYYRANVELRTTVSGGEGRAVIQMR